MTMRLREIDFIIAMFEKYGIQKRRYLQISPPPISAFFCDFWSNSAIKLRQIAYGAI